jgi:hypothetical protein
VYVACRLYYFNIDAKFLSKCRLLADNMLCKPTADLRYLHCMLLTSMEYVRFSRADNLSNSC